MGALEEAEEQVAPCEEHGEAEKENEDFYADELV